MSLRRKRITGLKEFHDTYRTIKGKVPELTNEYQKEFQDTFLNAVPADVIQPLGRKRTSMSIDEEGMFMSIMQAFDEGILNKLSERERHCFTDIIISCDEYTLVAERYHISVGAVREYVLRAAKKIRQYIEARDGE